MTKIFNVKVYGMEESLKASGYPMESETIGENKDGLFFCGGDEGAVETCFESFDDRGKALERGKKLGTAPTGSGHDNFLKGIIVQFDMEYTQYLTPQFQRYHFADIVSSQSKMHRITQMNIEESCNEYVDKRTIDNLKYWVKLYNTFNEIHKEQKEVNGNCLSWHYSKEEHGKVVDAICLPFPRSGEESDLYSKYDLFMKVVSNCPMGFKMTMRITSLFSYCLSTIGDLPST